MPIATIIRLAVVLFLCVSAGTHAGAETAEQAYLDRFVGQWSGTGTAEISDLPGAISVECEAIGQAGSDKVSVQGTCRALVFSREFSIDVHYQSDSGGYAGTYTGARAGPASVEGRRLGDQVQLMVNWLQPVGGALTAEMIIVNDGVAQMRIMLSDRPNGPGTPTQIMLDLNLTRRPR